jgi:hypothetical protein
LANLILRASSATGAFSPLAGSLVFTGVIDEVTDRLDILGEGEAVDVGAGDMTIELWLKPASSGNNTGSQTTGTGYKFPDTDIFFDRDNTSTTRDFGAGLAAGRVCWSAQPGGTGWSAVSTTDLRDFQWHHIAMQRSASTGVMEVFVDGDREVQTTGPTGTVSLPGGITGAERFFVFGTEKHGFDVEGYKGRMSTIQIWNTLVYSGATYAVPTAPAASNASGLVGQWLCNQGSGINVLDSTANANHGFIASGGVPAWNSDNPFG